MKRIAFFSLLALAAVLLLDQQVWAQNTAQWSYSQGSGNPNQAYLDAHIVQKGETLYSIALDYGMSVVEIKELNEMNSNSINVGDRILVRKKGGDQTRELAYGNSQPKSNLPPEVAELVFGASQPAEDGAPQTATRGLGNPQPKTYNREPVRGTAVAQVEKMQYHMVKKGEDLDEISRMYDVSVAELKAWNDITIARQGDVLIVNKWYESAGGSVNDQHIDDVVHNAGMATRSVDPYKPRVETRPEPVYEPKSLSATMQELAQTQGNTTGTYEPYEGRWGTRSISAVPEKEYVVGSVEHIGMLGSRIQKGIYTRYEMSNPQKRFYALHKTLPPGTIVHMAIPNNPGYIDIEIVGVLQDNTNAFIALSPACINILKDAGGGETVTIVYQ